MKTVYNLTKCVLVGAFLLLSMVVNAQIKGKIQSSVDNAGLPGASVVVKGTNKGVLSDTEGAFSIDAKVGDVLVISFVGYETIQMPAQDNMSLSMKPQSAFLQEYVATALDIRKTKASVGFAVQDIKGSELTKAREANPVANLVGKVAGLTIGVTGEMLGAPQVLLRGRQPLYVVDGVPINTDTWNISNDDIESITVLKGPTASAIYGSRGQFGAIQITTKRGTKDKRGFSVEFNSSTMVENGFTAIPKVQDLYGPGDHGEYAFVDGRGGGINDGDYDIWGPKFNGQPIPQYDSPLDPATGKRTGTPWVARGKDNLTRFLRPGLITTNNLSLSGSNEKFDYRVSGSYGYQQGIMPNTWLNTINLNTTAGFNISDKLRIETSINYNRQFTPNFPDVQYGPNSMIYNIITWGGADWNVDDFNPEKGGSYWQKGKEGVQQIYAEYQRYNNPYFMAYEWLRGHYKNDIYGFTALKYKILPNLTAQLRTQISTYDLLRNEKFPFSGTSYGREEGRGDYREDKRNLFDSNTDFLLSFDKNITEDFGVKASLGANLRNLYYRSSYVTTNYLNVPGLYTFSNSLNPLQSANYNAFMTVPSVYGYADFNYKTWAYLSVTGRVDKSSALLPKNNTYFYPSVSASILPSEMVNMGVISLMKFRASYANVGGSFTQNTIGTAGSFLGYGAGYNTPYGGPNYLLPAYDISKPFNNQTAAYYNRFLIDENLKPSFSSTYELGADIRFLKNRIGFDFNYFDAIDGPQIFNLPVSETSGPTSFRTNGLKTERKGIELTLTGVPVKTQDFSWDILANWSKYQETLKEIYAADPTITTLNTFFKVGDRLDKYIGSAFVRTGTTVVDGTTIYDPSKPIVYSGALPLRQGNQFLGYTNPDWVWSVKNTFTYKGLSLGIQFDGRVGGVIGDYVERQTYRGGRHIATVEGAMAAAREADTKGVKTWTGEGVTVNNGGKINYDNNGIVTNYSELQFTNNADKTYLQDWISRYYGTDEGTIHSRTYMKLRELTLTFQLPQNLLKNIGVRQASFSLIGRNLAYWSDVKDLDIDQYANPGSGQDNSVNGRSGLQTPTLRRYGINLNITF
jgi:TonB-linked SusC/RagA family outer membrane protein